MKILIFLFTVFALSYGNQYVFLVNKYDKEIELEAKIISKIAMASLNESAKIFIPNISKQEQKVYSKYLNLAQDCESANFVYNKNGSIETSCQNINKLFFTNNYRRLISNERYYGAFFWNKSRPNIVFIKKRLKKNSIVLSDEYAPYIEELDGL